MQYLSVSYRNDETDDNFDIQKEIDSPFIYDWINAMVDVLKLMGYGDGLIKDFLGDTYFTSDSKNACTETRVKPICVTQPVDYEAVAKKFSEELLKVLGKGAYV